MLIAILTVATFACATPEDTEPSVDLLQDVEIQELLWVESDPDSIGSGCPACGNNH